LTASKTAGPGTISPAGEDLNLELAAGGFGNPLGHELGTTVNGIEALREARRQTPLDGRRILGNAGMATVPAARPTPAFFKTNVFPQSCLL
jgi:hypothetical protein